MFRLFAFFLLLSGIASLTYQVVWVRLLGTSMGSTSAAVSTVLAAFFFGLAIGSYFAERVTKNRISDLRPYLYLEAIIAVSGLLLLPILLNLDSLIAAAPGMGSTIPMKFVLTMILLSIPTICMGATFPVMAALLIRKQSNFSVRMSQLYSLNTAGAVLGAGLSGFVFIPQIGLDGAVYLAVSINLFIVLLGFYYNRQIKLPPLPVTTSSDIKQKSFNEDVEFDTPLRKQALLLLFVTGFVSIACEVAWTKYLSIFTGTTIYGFAAILTIFLIGISAGAWAIRNTIVKITNPGLWISACVLILGASLIFTRVALAWIPTYYEMISQLVISDWLFRVLKYSMVFLILFIPTFIFGALFPINLKLYCGNMSGVRSKIGKAYALNTVASIFGAVVAGFYLIPEFGTDKLLTGMALLVLAIPLLFLTSIKKTASRIVIVSSALAIIMLSTWLPHIDYRQLINALDYNARYANSSNAYKNPKYLFLKEGRTGVVSMLSYNGHVVYLQNNGLKESVYDLKNENNVLLVESLLGLVPYFMHPNPKSAFVVGYGGGVTTKALTYTNLQSIKVVELEPAVIDANRAVQGGKISVLQDPRVMLEINDARNTLLTSKKKYDIIASQPSHPWLAHAATVFTREFFSLVKSRLTSKGIYGQWVNLFRMDVTTLKSLLKSFYTVFPEGMVFANINTGDLIMYGSNHPLYFDFAKINKRLSEPKVKKAMAFYKIMKAPDLLYYFAMSRKKALLISKDARINTDLNILSEVRLSALGRNIPRKENPYVFLKKQYRFDISSYFKTNLAFELNRVGTHFLTLNEFNMVYLISSQLSKIAPIYSRSLRYEIYWRQFNYQKAVKYYSLHTQWPDRIHMQQAIILSEMNQSKKARQVLSKILNKLDRLELAAQHFYIEKKYMKNRFKIAKEENVQGLLGYQKASLIKVGGKLNSIKQSSLSNLPKLAVLEQFYQRDKIRHKKMLDKFVRLKSEEGIKLKANMATALASSELLLARQLLKHMEKYKALDNDLLQEFKGEIVKLVKKLN